MAQALIILQCVALAALIPALLSAARWLWKSAPSYRKHGLADKRSEQEPDEIPPYVVVRPGAKPVKPKDGKRWLRP